MKASEFAKSILQDVMRSDVVEDARLAVSKINQYTLNMYEQADRAMPGYKPSSRIMVDLVSRVNSSLHSKFSDNGTNEGGKTILKPNASLINNIANALPRVAENLETVADFIQKSWNEKVMAGGLTYRNANLMQFVSMGTFLDKYSRLLLNYLFYCETNVDTPESMGIAGLNKAEIKWLMDYAEVFGTALSVCAVQTNRLMTLVSVMPDITIDQENPEAAEAIMGEDKTDALKLGFIPLWIHPVYKFRLWLTNWEIESYNEAKQDLIRLQLRIQYLEEQKKNGAASPQVERELQKVDELIENIKFKIAKTEGKVR